MNRSSAQKQNHPLHMPPRNKRESLSDSPPPGKILIIHSGGIGDMLLALPAMRILRENFPHASLDLMGRPERLSLIALDLRANSLLSVDRAGMAFFYTADGPLPPDLGAYFAGIDLCLLFAKQDRGVLAGNLRRAGTKRVVQIPSFPQEGLRVPICRYYSAELRKAGITGKDAFYPLGLPEEARSFAGEFWAEHDVKKGSKVLAIHPGSGSRAKNWDAENFATVADWAAGLAEILLLSGPAEEGSGEITRAMKRARPIFADGLPLLNVAALVAGCSAYLGNDSGITHLAALTGIPTVAVFGPTDPAVWGPAGPAVHIVAPGNAGPACLSLEGSPPPGCLKSIRSEVVIDILAPYLS
jgi:heptosyltransferase III